MSPVELDKLFILLKKFSKNMIKKTSQSIGYKCWETHIEYDQIKATGFGRDESEALHNCIRNFIDIMLEQEERFKEYIQALKTSLKELRDPQESENKANDSNFSSGMNQSFDQNTLIEQLGKKIGNISMIKDQVGITNNDNTLCLENEDIFLGDLKKFILKKKYNITFYQLFSKQIYESPKQQKKKPLSKQFQSSIEKLENLQKQSQDVVDILKKNQEKQISAINIPSQDCTQNIFCIHEQELKKEKLKVEHLELRMKLIQEENRILKTMIADQKHIPLFEDSQNIQKESKQQQQIYKQKAVDEPLSKSKNSSKMNQENEIQIINSERGQLSYKQRPGSVDDTRRQAKSIINSSLMTEKYQNLKNTKVPKLNLEILPNFHGKQTSSINQQLIQIYMNNHKGELIK